MHTPDTLIVGAGFGGLLTAILLANQGHKVTLIEATKTPGGRAISTTHDGVRVNLGPHALYLAGQAVATLEDLGISIKWTPTASISGARALLRDAIHTLPNSPGVLILRDVCELSTRECADALEMSEANVKTPLRRARKIAHVSRIGGEDAPTHKRRQRCSPNSSPRSPRWTPRSSSTCSAMTP